MVVHATAEVSGQVHETATVWHLAVVREHARVGAETSVGRGAYVGPGVIVGERCKIQNAALIYEPAVLADGVFVGPGVVFTNDLHPRAVTPQGRRMSADDWTAVGVTVGMGASIGARAVCIAPVAIGPWAMVAAGAVVTRDVPAFALVAGVPARRVGWVGRAGVRLEYVEDGVLRCPVSGRLHRRAGADLLVEEEDQDSGTSMPRIVATSE